MRSNPFPSKTLPKMQISKSIFNNKQNQCELSTTRMLLDLKHLFRVCISEYLDSGWYFIVMEYCDMGTLFNYQSKNPNKFLHLQQASKILMQILNAVQAVHRENIIHRDIKSDNIFLKKNKVGSGFRCKLGDFGFAK